MSRDPYTGGAIDSYQARKDEEVTQAIEQRPWIKNTTGTIPDLLVNTHTLVEVKWNNNASASYGAHIISRSEYWRIGSSYGYIKYWRPIDA